MDLHKTFHKRSDKFSNFTLKPLEQLQNTGKDSQTLGATPKPWEQLQNPSSNSKTLGAATPPSLTKTSSLIFLVKKSRIKTEKSIIVVFIVRTLKDDIYYRQMKMRPGELLLDQLDSIEDTKVNIYSHKVVFSVCLYVCS